MGTVSYRTIEHVAMGARPYPVALAGCETGLILFSSAFMGHNDAVHFAIAGVRATCVDHDLAKLDEMAELYPADWEWVQADVFDYITQTDRRWDIVSADPWSSEFQTVADRIDELCSLADRAVVIGSNAATVVEPPEGWKVTETVERSSHGVNWTVVLRGQDFE